MNRSILILGGLALSATACGPRERPTQAAVAVPPVGSTASALPVRPLPSASASGPAARACVCPWVQEGGWLRVPNGWVRQLVGVEAAWRAWPRIEHAEVRCGVRDEGGWLCVYQVDAAEPKSERDLKRMVDAAIEAVRPLGLKPDDGPLGNKALKRGDEVTLMLLGGPSQLVIRGTGSVREGLADWVRTCGGTSELAEELPWDALVHWGMSSDLEVQRWDFTFDRDVPSPWLEDSGWDVVEDEREVRVSRPVEPLSAAPRCDR